MGKRNVISVLLMVLALVMSGCASMQTAGHEYLMKGQVLDVTDDVAYLCVGSKDGAQVGQAFTVYRFEKALNPDPKSVLPYFKRVETGGKVKIAEIVDEHMATAKILAGSVKVNDVVELNP